MWCSVAVLVRGGRRYEDCRRYLKLELLLRGGWWTGEQAWCKSWGSNLYVVRILIDNTFRRKSQHLPHLLVLSSDLRSQCTLCCSRRTSSRTNLSSKQRQNIEPWFLPPSSRTRGATLGGRGYPYMYVNPIGPDSHRTSRVSHGDRS